MNSVILHTKKKLSLNFIVPGECLILLLLRSLMPFTILAKPILKKPSIYWGSRRIPCMVDQSSPLPTFHWQFQSGSCLQADLECEPSSEKWQNLPANLEVDPVVGIAAKKSTLSIPATFPSSFLRCTAKNLMGSDSWSLTYLENGEFVEVAALKAYPPH